MEKFVYHTFIYSPKGWNGGKVDKDKFNGELNKRGSEGWELVNCVASNEGYGSTRGIVCVFKKRVY